MTAVAETKTDTMIQHHAAVASLECEDWRMTSKEIMSPTRSAVIGYNLACQNAEAGVRA